MSWRSAPLPPGWSATRKRILRRDDYRCYRCGKRNANEVDHLLAAINGGGDEDSNLAAICNRCHKHKTGEDRREMYRRRSPIRQQPRHPGLLD